MKLRIFRFREDRRLLGNYSVVNSSCEPGNSSASRATLNRRKALIDDRSLTKNRPAMIFAMIESCGEWAIAGWLCVLERGSAAYLASQGMRGWAKNQGSGRPDQGGEAGINATPYGVQANAES